MGYLMASEYEAHGLSVETPDALVGMASALMEGYCKRPTLMAQQYTERIRLTDGAQTGRLSFGPVQALVSARVRYAQGRRGEFPEMERSNWLGLEVALTFGLPGTWTQLNVTTIDLFPEAREITFPRNFLGLGYNEAEVTYTAGFVTVPDRVKVACAQVVRNALATPALNVKSSKLDTMQVQYFGDTLLDEGVKALLKPFVAEKLG